MKKIYNAKFHLASCLIRMSNVTHNVLIFTHSHRARERERDGHRLTQTLKPDTGNRQTGFVFSHFSCTITWQSNIQKKSKLRLFKMWNTTKGHFEGKTSSELVFVWALGLSAVRQSVSQFMKYDLCVHKLVVWIWRYPFFKDIMGMY